jgi:DNA-binding PucR family transcriptional regulator
MIRTREHLRRAVLTQLLDGTEEGDRVELERALGYPLRSTHLAVIAEAADRAQLERHLATWQAAADASGTLLLQRAARRWVVWLGRSAPYRARELQGLSQALARSGLRVAGGEPWPGIDGLRRTHEEASMAASVQRALGPGVEAVLWYRDVRLEALLLADESRARRFVIEELGPLAGADPRLARIRETLLVSLSTGTHVGAAALLGVHENTVRNRIRQAEEMLPGAMTGRRTELQVALRLERVLGRGAVAHAHPEEGGRPQEGRPAPVAATPPLALSAR